MQKTRTGWVSTSKKCTITDSVIELTAGTISSNGFWIQLMFCFYITGYPVALYNTIAAAKKTAICTAPALGTWRLVMTTVETNLFSHIVRHNRFAHLFLIVRHNRFVHLYRLLFASLTRLTLFGRMFASLTHNPCV